MRSRSPRRRDGFSRRKRSTFPSAQGRSASSRRQSKSPRRRWKSPRRRLKSPRRHSKFSQRRSRSKSPQGGSRQIIDSRQDQLVQESLQTDNKWRESLGTAQTPTKWNRSRSSEKDDESLPQIKRRSVHRESGEDRKASSDDSEDRETKPNDPRHKRSKFTSNNDIDRTNRNMQSGQRTSSGSDSDEQEESRHTSHFRQRKGSHLDDDENALKNARLHANDDEQTSKTVTRHYKIEESHGTSRLFNREEKTSTNDRSITKEKQSDSSKDYSVQRKDWQTQHVPHHKDDKKNANSETSDLLTENKKRSMVPLRGRVGLNTRVFLSVKEAIEGAAAVEALIVTEVLQALRRGTGNHVIIIVTIIVIIIKETPRHQRDELKSRVAVIIQAVNMKCLVKH